MDISKTLYGASDRDDKIRYDIKKRAKELENKMIVDIMSVLFWTGRISEKQVYVVGKFAEAQGIDLTGSSTHLADTSTNSK
jgi:hypothetical protein